MCWKHNQTDRLKDSMLEKKSNPKWSSSVEQHRTHRTKPETESETKDLISTCNILLILIKLLLVKFCVYFHNVNSKWIMRFCLTQIIYLKQQEQQTKTMNSWWSIYLCEIFFLKIFHLSNILPHWTLPPHSATCYY